MPAYVTKREQVQAEQWTDPHHPPSPLCDVVKGHLRGFLNGKACQWTAQVLTHEGLRVAFLYDWIVRDDRGRLHVLTPRVFEQRYEEPA